MDLNFTQICYQESNQQCKPSLVQLNKEATSYYLNQWLASLLTHICITRPRWVKISPLSDIVQRALRVWRYAPVGYNKLYGFLSWLSLKTMASWWRHQMEAFSALLALCAGNHRSPVNSPHKGQWRGALIFSLICAWINAWVNNREAGDYRRHRAPYDVIVIFSLQRYSISNKIYTWCRFALLEVWFNYSDVTMSAMTSQIIGVLTVYSTGCSGADQRKHQNSASLAFVGEFTGERWIPRTKGQ